MKVTIDGITYEGTPAEIRDIIENPPQRPPIRITSDCPDNDKYNTPAYPPYAYAVNPCEYPKKEKE